MKTQLTASEIELISSTLTSSTIEMGDWLEKKKDEPYTITYAIMIRSHRLKSIIEKLRAMENEMNESE